MSNGISDVAITAALNHMVGSTTYTKPTGHKLHLYTGDPHAAGTEVSAVTHDTAYAAQAVTFADEGVTTNNRCYINALLTFAAVVYGSGAAPYNVTHWALKDGSGVLLWAAEFDTPITRNAGEPLAFASGSLYIEMART